MLGLLSEKYVKNHTIIAKKISTETSEEKPILPPISVTAKSFVVYDLKNNKVLLSKNESEVLPLASLTKLQTAYLFAERNDLRKKIIIPSLGSGHTYDFTLKPGDSWEVSELIKFMLTLSSNDAAEILASADSLGREGFIKLMNEEINATSTFSFTTPNGLDIGDNIGGLGTALDMTTLIKHFYKNFPDLFEATTKSKMTVTISGQSFSGIPNTNQNVESYRGISGSKTGFTDKAGGNLAILYDEGLGNPIAIVILGSTKEGRFEDMRTILTYTLLYYNELYPEVN